MDGDAPLRQALAAALTRVGGLADRAGELAARHFDEPIGEAMRGPEEDARVVQQVLDRFADELALARDQVRQLAGERDRAAQALARERESAADRERALLARESELTLKATELSRQLGEMKTNRGDGGDRRTTPRERARIAELEATLHELRGERVQLVDLLREARARVAEVRAMLAGASK